MKKIEPWSFEQKDWSLT